MTYGKSLKNEKLWSCSVSFQQKTTFYIMFHILGSTTGVHCRDVVVRKNKQICVIPSIAPPNLHPTRGLISQSNWKHLCGCAEPLTLHKSESKQQRLGAGCIRSVHMDGNCCSCSRGTPALQTDCLSLTWAASKANREQPSPCSEFYFVCLILKIEAVTYSDVMNN